MSCVEYYPWLYYRGAYKWELPGSKSLSNRWLIINYLCDGRLQINNLSQAADSLLLYKLLKQLKAQKYNVFNCENAGTVARFMTALLCVCPGSHILTGWPRMKQRPMAELIDALRGMGAKIRYLEAEGQLPIEVEGGELSGGEVRLSGETSSQFASALLLVASKMAEPLILKFDKEPVSKPYISMTCEVLKTCGYEVSQMLQWKETGVQRLMPTMWWHSRPKRPSSCRDCLPSRFKATELCASGTKSSAFTRSFQPTELRCPISV